MSTRISDVFDSLRARNRAGFIPFIMAGDPDYETSLHLMNALADTGADCIELGMCFTDPMADGPVIQAAGLRALKSGHSAQKTIEMVKEFRTNNNETPIILMGYFNPISSYGAEIFVGEAADAGVDGLIIVDLPPEEDAALCAPARAAGLDFIRLAAPTTDPGRLTDIVASASGFVYYVSIAGITGGGHGETAEIVAAIDRIKGASGLPVAVGFGVNTPQSAAGIARVADAVVVGSALISALANSLASGKSGQNAVKPVLSLATELAKAVHSAR